ncbi:MAG: dephospho-CoA kinase [Candidatus Gastranaerophilales bacterium]|nr:dephospho-CoA kinase [Candidatus Gastranaerophilales bacterium]
MQKIALTGNIASGKSLVEEQFQSLGFDIIDADKIAHEVLVEKLNVLQNLFGKEIINQGQLSREKLAQIVFSNPSRKQKLESIIHPEVKRRIEEFQKGKTISIASIPLLFEVGWEGDFDKVILVIAKDSTRQKRLMERSGLTKEQAKIRMNAQISQGDKINKADFVIDNNGSKEETFEQVKQIYDKLK